MISQTAEVNISWQYKNFPGKMKIYEPNGNPPLWQTESVKKLEDAPVKKEVPKGIIFMKRGESKTLILVMKNETDHPLYFFAAPHQVNPPDYSLGFKFHCLCVNMSFSVMPGETWYRVVSLDLFPGFTGDKVSVTHILIGLDKPVNVFLEHERHDM